MHNFERARSMLGSMSVALRMYGARRVTNSVLWASQTLTWGGLACKTTVEYGLSKLGYTSLKAEQMCAIGKGYLCQRTNQVWQVPHISSPSSSLDLWLGGRFFAEQAAHATVLPCPRPRPAACHPHVCNVLALSSLHMPTVMNTNDICSLSPSFPSVPHAVRTTEHGTTHVGRESSSIE